METQHADRGEEPAASPLPETSEREVWRVMLEGGEVRAVTVEHPRRHFGGFETWWHVTGTTTSGTMPTATTPRGAVIAAAHCHGWLIQEVLYPGQRSRVELISELDELTRERDAALELANARLAIIAGSTTPPTLAEIAAHDGLWLIARGDDHVTGVVHDRAMRLHTHRAGDRYIPLRDGCPCARPVVAADPGTASANPDDVARLTANLLTIYESGRDMSGPGITIESQRDGGVYRTIVRVSSNVLPELIVRAAVERDAGSVVDDHLVARMKIPAEKKPRHGEGHAEEITAFELHRLALSSVAARLLELGGHAPLSLL